MSPVSATPSLLSLPPTPVDGPIQYSGVLPDADNPYGQGAAWVDGEYVPVLQARIPLLDAGFLHSDVTYTVAGVWHGNFFRLSDHLDRLLSGADHMRLVSPLTKAEITDICLRVTALTQLREAYVSISLSRGIEFAVGAPAIPQIYIYAIPWRWIFTPAEQLSGISAVVPRGVRRVSRHTIDPQVKNYQWGDLLQGRFEASDRGARNAILLDDDGLVAEGPGFNVLIVKDGQITTPAANALPGVTRRTALEIAESMGIPAALTDVPGSALYEADEIFSTTTASGITPIVELDGVPVGSGVPGPISSAIQKRYWELMDEPSDLIEPVPY